MTQLCTRIHTLAVAMLIGLSATACQERAAGTNAASEGRSRYADATPNAALQTLVEGNDLSSTVALPRMTTAERTRLADQVKRFYKNENYQLMWIDGDRPSNRYQQLVKVLDAADDHGLPAELYKIPIQTTDNKNVRIPAESAPKIDVQATAAFFRYFIHLTGGRLDPHAIESLWTLKPERPDLVAVLTDAVEHDSLAKAMDQLKPTSQQYGELQKALMRYRAIAAKGGWQPVATVKRLKPGESTPLAAALRHRLAIEGDLDAAHENDQTSTYDEVLVDGVKRFQERHRIKADGIITPDTIAALNIPVNEKIRTIELNMERWRWLPDKLPARYIMVNVPDFRLEAVENGSPVLSMRVVVGAPDKKTPIFADEMTTVIFSPYWNVPPDIAKKETAPAAAKDPSYLDRNNMEVVNASGEVVDPSSVDWSNPTGVRIRQRPGSGNALGGVKFIFPNNFDVYLHDTNAGKLFDRIERGLSHGCVRVEEPHKLAQYVLRDFPEWTPEAITDAMQAGKEKHVKLKTPIPVYIVYLTAWVHDGGVRFLKDIYGHDADQSAQLWPKQS